MWINGVVTLWIIKDVNNPYILPVNKDLLGKLKDGKDDIIMQINLEFYARTWDDDQWVKLALNYHFVTDEYFTKF